MRKRKWLILLLAGMLFNSCATVIGGRYNILVFSTKGISGAEVYIDGEKIAEAPGRVRVPKEKIQHGSRLVLKAEGYQDKEYVILRKQSALYSVADLLTGVVPLVVDYATGNIYRPRPRRFVYEPQKDINPNQPR